MTTKERFILDSFRSTAFHSNFVHILQRRFGPCHFLIWFLNSANVIKFFILFGRSFNIFAPLYRNEGPDGDEMFVFGLIKKKRIVQTKPDERAALTLQT